MTRISIDLDLLDGSLLEIAARSSTGEAFWSRTALDMCVTGDSLPSQRELIENERGVLLELAGHVTSWNGREFWFRTSYLDAADLESLYRKHGLETPFHWTQVRDLDTLVSMPCVSALEEYALHDDDTHQSVQSMNQQLDSVFGS